MSSSSAEIQLHLAARTNNLKAASHLLNTGSDPNAVLKRHLYPEDLVNKFEVDLWTPLHCAVDVQSEKIVQLLIKHKANVNVEDEYGRTPLNIAASRGNVQIVELLLYSGADVDSYVSKDENLTVSGKPKWRIREPLHSAVESNSFAIVKILLERKANVNIEDRWSRTPLFLSILEGNSKIVELLLDYGADIEKSVDANDRKSKKTVLHHIAEKLQVKLMKFLSSKFESKFNEIQRILNLCFYRNFHDVSYSDKEKFESVIQIIEEHDKILRIFLNNDVDVNCIDDNASTPLHSACREGNWRIAKTLMENGAEVDLQEKTGKTPLHLALVHKRRAIVEILLDYEASFLISDNDGLTPLNYQCRFCPDFDLECHVVKIEILKMTEKEYLIQDVLSHFERQCLEEIFSLRTEHFRYGISSFSLYHIFTDESNEKLIRLSKNEEFWNEVFSDGFYKKFSIYGDILRGRLEKAKWRNDLIDKGVDPLSYILGAIFPPFILEEILHYLSNADIVNLITLYNKITVENACFDR